MLPLALQENGIYFSCAVHEKVCLSFCFGFQMQFTKHRGGKKNSWNWKKKKYKVFLPSGHHILAQKTVYSLSRNLISFIRTICSVQFRSVCSVVLCLKPVDFHPKPKTVTFSCTIKYLSTFFFLGGGVFYIVLFYIMSVIFDIFVFKHLKTFI